MIDSTHLLNPKMFKLDPNDDIFVVYSVIVGCVILSSNAKQYDAVNTIFIKNIITEIFFIISFPLLI